MPAPVSVGAHCAATSLLGGETPALVGVGGAYITIQPIPFYSDHRAAFAGYSTVKCKDDLQYPYVALSAPRASVVPGRELSVSVESMDQYSWCWLGGPGGSLPAGGAGQ